MKFITTVILLCLSTTALALEAPAIKWPFKFNAEQQVLLGTYAAPDLSREAFLNVLATDCQAQGITTAEGCMSELLATVHKVKLEGAEKEEKGTAQISFHKCHPECTSIKNCSLNCIKL